MNFFKNLFKKPKPEPIKFQEIRIPDISSEPTTIELPSIKVTYWITFDERSEDERDIEKEVKFYGLHDLCRIPVVGDYILFGDSGNCGFKVTIVTRAQDKNEISIHADHVGHDGGLVCSEMIEKHGFDLFGIKGD